MELTSKNKSKVTRLFLLSYPNTALPTYPSQSCWRFPLPQKIARSFLPHPSPNCFGFLLHMTQNHQGVLPNFTLFPNAVFSTHCPFPKSLKHHFKLLGVLLTPTLPFCPNHWNIPPLLNCWNPTQLTNSSKICSASSQFCHRCLCFSPLSYCCSVVKTQRRKGRAVLLVTMCLEQGSPAITPLTNS